MDAQVTVLVMTYNHEKYLTRCLDSIIIQETNFPFKIIVGDDASTDGTTDILRDFANKYPDIIVPVFHEKNVGATENCFQLADMVKTKYCVMVDGDDYWTSKEKLQKHYDFLESHPDFMISMNRSKVIYMNSQKSSFLTPMGKICKKQKVFTLDEYIRNECTAQSPMYRWIFNEKSTLRNAFPNFDFLPGDFYIDALHLKYGKAYLFDDVMDEYLKQEHGIWWLFSEDNDGFKEKYGHLLLNRYIILKNEFNFPEPYYSYFKDLFLFYLKNELFDKMEYLKNLDKCLYELLYKNFISKIGLNHKNLNKFFEKEIFSINPIIFRISKTIYEPFFYRISVLGLNFKLNVSKRKR